MPAASHFTFFTLNNLKNLLKSYKFSILQKFSLKAPTKDNPDWLSVPAKKSHFVGVIAQKP